VIGEQREQELLADGRVPGPAADALEPLESLAVEPGLEQGHRDQTPLQEAVELGVGAGELTELLREDRGRLVGARDEEELAAKQERGLGSWDRVVDQPVRLPQMLDRGIPAQECLGGAELEQQAGALHYGRRLGERAAKVGNRTLGSTARASAARGIAQRRDDL
jgi:hypothetical protein